MMKKIFLLGAVACAFAACKPSVSISPNATPGGANFTSYLAIGNSLTAGYADGSLYVTGQLNSYPERLFEQFSQVSPRGAQGPFVIPLLSSDQGYPAAKLILAETYLPCNLFDSTLGPIAYPSWTYNAADAAPYVSNAPNASHGQINNIGVPGIRMVDYPVVGYGASNVFAARFYNNTATTPQDELYYRIHNLHPTFFTMWLGANDVLGYALAGGQGDGSGQALPIAGDYFNPNDISNIDSFKNDYDNAVRVATSTGALGALINIPDVTKLPYFTTIPANGLLLTRVAQRDSLRNAYGTGYAFDTGYNYFVITDNVGRVRQSVRGELILLSATDSQIACHGWGSTTPIPNQYVITTDELQNIENATNEINAFIQNEALVYNLAYVDMYTFMGKVSTGYAYNGIQYNAQFVSGGAFSLDAIHLTPRGYALVANQIIDAINAKYKSTVHEVDANQFNGILFP